MIQFPTSSAQQISSGQAAPWKRKSLADHLSETLAAAELTTQQRLLFQAFAKTCQREVNRLEFMASQAARNREIANNLLSQTVDGLQQRSAELEANEQRLADTVARLQLANDDMQHFMHVASHDLKTPLRSIGSFANLIERRHAAELSEGALEYFDYIKRNAANMNGLITDLVNYNRAIKFEEPTEVDLDAMFAEVQLGLYADLAESGADVRCAPLGTVTSARSALSQVMQNLVRNAIVYRDLDRDCIIELTIVRHDAAATLCVRDNGLGLDPAYREKVFKPFQRVGDLSRPGTGMGLAICRRIARETGGDIDYLGAPGVGTSFYVGLGAPPLISDVDRAYYNRPNATAPVPTEVAALSRAA